jgi:hypothetical protein
MSMDLELKRTSRDRDLYELEGVGTLRLEGRITGRATAEAGSNRWDIARRGLWRQLQATDALGTVVGAFDRRLIGGSRLHWRDRRYTLRRASVWRERYALAEGDREVALLDAKGWGKRPVRISVDNPSALDPGLLLFAAFVADTLAGDSSAGSTAAFTVTAGGAS